MLNKKVINKILINNCGGISLFAGIIVPFTIFFIIYSLSEYILIHFFPIIFPILLFIGIYIMLTIERVLYNKKLELSKPWKKKGEEKE